MSRRFKWMLTLGVLVVGGGVISMAIGGGGQVPRGPGSEVPSPASGSTPSTPVIQIPETSVPSGVEVDGRPDIVPPGGFERSEGGARAAAVGYLEATEEAVALSPADAAAVQWRFASADFADEFATDTEQRMAELIEAVPGGVTLRVAPIEARSIADGEDWLVSVWYAQAITLVGEGVVDDWRTANYRLRWEDDTWKIASFESSRGPMPGRGAQPASATPSQFEALLSGYSDDGLS